MTARILDNKYRIAFLLVILAVYMLNGIGALDLNLRGAPILDFNAAILNSVLRSMLADPLSGPALGLLITLIGGLMLALLLPVLAAIPAAGLTLLVSLPLLYLYLAETRIMPVLPMEYSFIILLVLFASNALVSYFIETHARSRLLTVFGQYIPPDVVRAISKQGGIPNLEGESRLMTVFFCDLQDFSNVAEQLNPRQLAALLNEYFDAMTEILFRHGATIDKYIGDAIMAFWGAPLPQADHAQRAVLAAMEMHARIAELSRSFLSRGWPGPVMGIGINTGMMNVGNMGSRYRIAYTVIGDAVNLASRIETLTRRYRLPTLVSEATMRDCPDIVFREIDQVQVKGKHNATRIWAPVCRKAEMTPALTEKLRLHADAMAPYLAGRVEEARSLFTSLQAAYPEDPFYPAMLTLLGQQPAR